ncbi:MAG: VanZ family protein [Anaerolineae bacterium]|nr:VanZ family protein [Anaerolineae bacterium]
MIRLVRWLPALAWMALIFVLSDQPVLLSVTNNALLDIVFKKSAHILTYAILMGLVFWALGVQHGAPNGAPNRPHTLLAFAIVLAYAASDEFHQSFVPGRASRWTDVAIFDLAGACIGWLAWHRRSVSAGRSRIAWVYACLFVYAIALAILLNLPYTGRAEQDPSPLLTDTWFLWGLQLLRPVAHARRGVTHRGWRAARDAARHTFAGLCHPILCAGHFAAQPVYGAAAWH